MSGYNDVLRLRRVEKECNELGFRLAHPKWSGDQHGSLVAVLPKDEYSVPIFSRDAELFVGTIEQLEHWLNGIDWARKYDSLLKVSDNKKRARKEQDYRNQQLARILKGDST